MIPRVSDRDLSLMAATLQNIHDTQREQIALAKETKVLLERIFHLLEATASSRPDDPPLHPGESVPGVEHPRHR